MVIAPSLLQGVLESFCISEAKRSLVFPLEAQNRAELQHKAKRMILKFSFHLLEMRLD